MKGMSTFQTVIKWEDVLSLEQYIVGECKTQCLLLVMLNWECKTIVIFGFLLEIFNNIYIDQPNKSNKLFLRPEPCLFILICLLKNLNLTFIMNRANP